MSRRDIEREGLRRLAAALEANGLTIPADVEWRCSPDPGREGWGFLLCIWRGYSSCTAFGPTRGVEQAIAHVVRLMAILWWPNILKEND